MSRDCHCSSMAERDACMAKCGPAEKSARQLSNEACEMILGVARMSSPNIASTLEYVAELVVGLESKAHKEGFLDGEKTTEFRVKKRLGVFGAVLVGGVK